MSHVTTIDCIMSEDVEVLREMCQLMGWQLHENQKTYKWYGKHVGDYPIPNGFKKEDLGKCQHAITVPGAAYQIGIAKSPLNPGQLTPLFDFWRAGGLDTALGGENANVLKSAYAVSAAKVATQRKGYHCEVIRNPAGGYKLLTTKIENKNKIGWRNVVSKTIKRLSIGG